MTTPARIAIAAIATIALAACAGQSPADKAAAQAIAAGGPITVSYEFHSPRHLLPGIPNDGETRYDGEDDQNSNLPELLVKLGYAKPYHSTITTLDYNVQPPKKSYDISLSLAHGVPSGWTCKPETDESAPPNSESCDIPIGTMVAGKAQMTNVMGQNLVHYMCTPEPNALGKMLTYKGNGVSSDGVAHPGRFDGSNWRNDDGDDNGNLWTFGKTQQCTVTLRADGSIEK